MRDEEKREVPELWLPVPESYLQVSDRGRVRSLADGEPYVLRCSPNTAGYPQVGWYWQGKRRAALVHRLVLTAFRGPCPPGMEARHLDGDQTNPCIDNLAWGTKRENADDKVRHGTSARKLCRIQVIEIKKRLLAQETTRSIARHFGISSVLVVYINRGKAWAHVPNPPQKGSDAPAPYPLSTATRWSRREGGIPSPPASSSPTSAAG